MAKEDDPQTPFGSLRIFRGELLVSGSVLLDPIIMVQWKMAPFFTSHDYGRKGSGGPSFARVTNPKNSGCPKKWYKREVPSLKLT